MQNDILLRLVDFDPHYAGKKWFPQRSFVLPVSCYYVAFFFNLLMSCVEGGCLRYPSQGLVYIKRMTKITIKWERKNSCLTSPQLGLSTSTTFGGFTLSRDMPISSHERPSQPKINTKSGDSANVAGLEFKNRTPAQTRTRYPVKRLWTHKSQPSESTTNFDHCNDACRRR